MNIKDLRIGNLIFQNNKVVELSSLHSDNTIRIIDNNIEKGCYKLNNNFAPIPLTEEWLLKFGFGEKCKSAGNRWQFFNGKDWFELYDFYDDEEKLIGKLFYNFTFEIKYVHQLQNLYFALTQRELTVA